MTKRCIGLAALTSVLVAGAAQAQDKIKGVGVTATLEGTYTILGVDGIAGFNAAVKNYKSMGGGKQLEFAIASTDATPDSAIRAVRKLIDQDKAQILISPLSGDEGIAVKNFSRTHPELTFINAASGAQETTFPVPSPNFFRWNMDGAQWQVGLGDYAYNTKGYRKIATVAEDYSFVYTQVEGLVLDFCRFGGQVTSRQWAPLGTKDFASTIAALPDDVDAIYLGLGGADAVNFLNQYQQAGGKAHLLDHGPPDRALGERRRKEGDDRHDRGERHGRHLGRSALEGVREALSGGDACGQAFAEPGAARGQLS